MSRKFRVSLHDSSAELVLVEVVGRVVLVVVVWTRSQCNVSGKEKLIQVNIEKTKIQQLTTGD